MWRVLSPPQCRCAVWVGNLSGTDGLPALVCANASSRHDRIPAPVLPTTLPTTTGYRYQVELRRTQNITPRTYFDARHNQHALRLLVHARAGVETPKLEKEKKRRTPGTPTMNFESLSQVLPRPSKFGPFRSMFRARVQNSEPGSLFLEGILEHVPRTSLNRKHGALHAKEQHTSRLHADDAQSIPGT